MSIDRFSTYACQRKVKEEKKPRTFLVNVNYRAFIYSLFIYLFFIYSYFIIFLQLASPC